MTYTPTPRDLFNPPPQLGEHFAPRWVPESPKGPQVCDASVGGCGREWEGGSYPCENGSDPETHEPYYCGAQYCPNCGTCQGALRTRREDRVKMTQ